MIEFACPDCHRWLKADHAHAGRQTRCACGRAVAIPVPLTEEQIQKTGATPCHNCGEHILLKAQVCPFCREEKSPRQKAADAKLLEARHLAKLARKAEKEREQAQRESEEQAALERLTLPPLPPLPPLPTAVMPAQPEALALEDQVAAAYQNRPPSRSSARRGNLFNTILLTTVSLVICTCAILCTIAIMRAPNRVIPTPTIQPSAAAGHPATAGGGQPAKNKPAAPTPHPAVPPEDPGF